MPVPPLNLDDRSFAQLLEAAVARIRQVNRDWTDFSPGNPGMTLVDVFAHLTEQTSFRVNRVSDKLKVELLRLLDISPRPAAPAVVRLRLERAASHSREITIPRFTRVLADGGVTFTILEERRSLPTEASLEVAAYQVERITEEAERTTGTPGQTWQVRRSPLAYPLTRALELVVGVERLREDPAPALEEPLREGEVDWTLWREVESFADTALGPHSIQVDRWSGQIRFPPYFSADGEAGRHGIPSPGRQVRLWYYRTSGASGNVPRGAEWRLVEPILGIASVAPTGPAVGGRDAETIEQATRRAPLEVARLRRAVTAADYEAYALQVPGVRRARALPAAQHRPGAAPGTVDLILVPAVHKAVEEVSVQDLENPQREVWKQVVDLLQSRQVLGSVLNATWARVQPIDVSATVVVDTTVPTEQMRSRLLSRVHRLIQPLGDWPFGQAVRVSNVYEALLAEPGVRYAENVQLFLPISPTGSCRCVASLEWIKPGVQQPQFIWFASSGARLFQSQNQGESWEVSKDFSSAGGAAPAVAEGGKPASVDASGTQIRALATSTDPQQTLLVAVAVMENKSTRVLVSRDAGETWQQRAQFAALEGSALAWVQRAGRPYLLVGTSAGLYELNYASDEGPKLLAFDPKNAARAVASLAAIRRGSQYYVALAPQGSGEWFLSREDAEVGTFQSISADQRQVRCVAFQRMGARYFLWAGLAADGKKDYGCLRVDLLESTPKAMSWERGWVGGTCAGLAFSGNIVLAASNHAGVLRLDPDEKEAAWQAPDRKNGLPISERDASFQPIQALAGAGDAVIVGAEQGIFRSTASPDTELGVAYASCSDNAGRDKVSLPEHWLPCSGRHRIEIRHLSAS